MKPKYKFPSGKKKVVGKNPTKTFIGGIVIGTFLGIFIQAFIISVILL